MSLTGLGAFRRPLHHPLLTLLASAGNLNPDTGLISCAVDSDAPHQVDYDYLRPDNDECMCWRKAGGLSLAVGETLTVPSRIRFLDSSSVAHSRDRESDGPVEVF
mmetsp:Transcript_33633/g.80468  ORF Transcript_33633/g.80468 Transcript_33633/m.80468 type:complete len:105 (-) Transcript_33633:226-540(-)